MAGTSDHRSRLLVLVSSAACALVTAFALSAYPLFLPALTKEFSWSQAEAIIPYSLSMIAWGATQPVAGVLLDRLGTRPVILVGVLLMGLGYVIMGFAHSIWLLAIGFGAFVGVATSASGTIPFAVLIAKWFPRSSRGSGVGLVQAAMPAGPILIAPALLFVMDALGWRAGTFGLGFLLLAVTLPIAFVGVRDPARTTADAALDQSATGWRQSVGLLRQPCLRNLFLERIACGLSTLMIAFLPASTHEFGFEHHVGAYSLSVFGASAALASFLGGLAADRWGRVPVLVATFLIRGLGTLIVASLSLDSAFFYVAVAIALGPIYATVAVNNVQIFEIVGARRAGFITGLSLVLHQVAAAAGPYLTGLVFDWTGTYRVSFFALGVILLVAAIPAAGTAPPAPRVPLEPVLAAADAS